ncbi:hypothetical protein QOZ80_4BG0356970 [Eleusine coracana subsp. coracana]|nr:hypothetical protein QOZ80_4BG0356970 [Eleusine coracana subsp. coracana]
MAPETTVLPPLPYEIAEDIFLRLPVKSVAASRCVSPAWNKFLSSAAFTDRYNAVAAARAAPAFVTLSDETFRRVFCGAVLVGWPSEGEFYLCNPSSGGALLLPPRRHPPWVIFSAGLGYDACARKHKVVLLEELGGLEQRRCKQLQCRVVTVGAGHWRWRAPRGREKTPDVSRGEIVSIKADPVFADGHLHWMLMAHGDHVVGIISFTLGSESFRRLPVPPAFGTDNSKPGVGTLGELDGHLCFLRDLRCRREAVALFELWMLGDLFKPNSSWSLERRIDLTPHVGKELKSAWDGEFFVVCNVIDGESKKILMATADRRDRRAYVYAPNTGELRCVARRNKAHVLYQESLVQVQGMEYGNKHIKFKFRSTGPLTQGSKRLCFCMTHDD